QKREKTKANHAFTWGRVGVGLSGVMPLTVRLRFTPATALIGALFLLCAQASAEPPGAALRLYVAGDFLAAASAAQAQPSSSSQAFAARALMAACLSADDRSQTDALLDRAESAARQALRLDPQSVEARLQMALALGVRARQANIAEAIAHNYAPRGHRLIL